VRNYVSVILQKLGVDDRTQAAVAAHRRGLVSPSDRSSGDISRRQAEPKVR
jgi:hypothetical protein